MIYLHRIPKFCKALQKKKSNILSHVFSYQSGLEQSKPIQYADSGLLATPPKFLPSLAQILSLSSQFFFLHETSFTCALNYCVCPDGCHIFICALRYTLPLATNLSLNSGIFSFCSTIEFFLVKKLCILKKIRYTCVQYLNSPLCIYCVIYNMYLYILGC